MPAGIYQRTKEHCENIRKSKLGKKRPDIFRQKHFNWKGGKRWDRGYLTILKPDHPRATKNGYVKNCYLVMEKHIGRFLNPKEFIHHINHIRSDDRLKNLQLVNRSTHCKIENPIYHRWYPHD